MQVLVPLLRMCVRVVPLGYVCISRVSGLYVRLQRPRDSVCASSVSELMCVYAAPRGLGFEIRFRVKAPEPGTFRLRGSV